MRITKLLRISSFQIIIGSFLAVILTGTLLLMLPVSSAEGAATPFGDALFTATSAVCVTGLVVHDTFRYWSLFGQLCILLLIQIGGLGTITLATVVTMLAGRKISLFQRSIMKDAVSADQIGGIVRYTLFILSGTLAVEFLGVITLFPIFFRKYPLPRCILYSVFHSVSAFCNAGFDLMGKDQPFTSLTGYTGSIPVNLTIMTLIVVGGLGFRTWSDIGKNKTHLHKYRLQTKLILTTTAILIFVPAVLFFIIEYQGYPLKERILASLFQSVTTRTAGFNTTDFNEFSDAGKLLSIALMLIGGSPGSTAGGMKTTTIAVLILNANGTFRHRDEASAFSHLRSLPDPVHCQFHDHQPCGIHSAAHLHVRSGFRDRNSGTDPRDHPSAGSCLPGNPDLFDVFWQSRRTDPDLRGCSIPQDAQPAHASRKYLDRLTPRIVEEL